MESIKTQCFNLFAKCLSFLMCNVHAATQPPPAHHCNQLAKGAATSQTNEYSNQPDTQAKLLHELEGLWDTDLSGRSTPEEQSESRTQNLQGGSEDDVAITLETEVPTRKSQS